MPSLETEYLIERMVSTIYHKDRPDQVNLWASLESVAERALSTRKDP